MTDTDTGRTAGDAATSPGRDSLTASTFRAVFRRHPAGVAVVTAAGPTGPVGITVTSLTTVSAEAAVFSFNVSRTASGWPVLQAAPHFAVHLLGAHQVTLAKTFATSGADRFGPTTGWVPGPEGVPVLDRVQAALLARPLQVLDVDDHSLVLARFQQVLTLPGRSAPLVWYDGDFRTTVTVR